MLMNFYMGRSRKKILAKRVNGAGSIIHSKKRNRWIYQYHVQDIAGNKHRRSLTAKTRAELERRIEKIDLTVAPNATVSWWISRWMTMYLSHSVKKSTMTFYGHMLSYLPESIKKMAITKLTPMDCQKMLTDLLIEGRRKGGPLSTSTVRSIRSSLITCFDAAKEVGIITSNPFKLTKAPRLIRKEKVFLTPKQANRLLSTAEKGNYYIDKTTADPGQLYLLQCYAVLIRVALMTGMRRGELFGLTWSNVNLDENQLIIQYQSQYSKEKGYYLGTPKTKTSIRKISIDGDTAQKLRNWFNYQTKYSMLLGNQFKNTYKLVFTNEFGTFVHPDNFRNRHWAAMCYAAKLPKGCTLHSLRHTAATLMLQAGIDIKTCAQRLGHANANILLRVYAHVLSQNDIKAADTLATIIAPKQALKKKKSDDGRPQSEQEDIQVKRY